MSTRVDAEELLESVPMIAARVDLAGRVTYLNQSGKGFWGVHPDRSWAEFAGLAAQEADTLLRRAREHGAVKCDAAATAPDGRRRRLRWSLVPQPGSDDVLAFGADLTEQDRAEDDARQQRTLLRTIIDAIPDIIFCKDPSGRYFLTNEAYSRFFGLTAEQLRGRRDEDFFPEEDARSFRQDDRLTMALGHPRTIHEWVPSANGRRMLIETIKAPLADVDGESLGIVGIARDTTERWYSDQAQQRREAILATLVRASHRFLEGDGFSATAPAVLEDIGTATGANRVTLFENRLAADGSRHVHPLFRWPLAMDSLSEVIRERTYGQLGLGRWEKLLATGETVVGTIDALPDEEQGALAALGVRSIVVLPIFVGSQWWGIMTVVDSEDERTWYPDEVDGLKLAAATIGSAVMRDRAVQAVVAAKEEAETAYRAKSLFLANLGHEIRTPMHGILSYARFGLKKTGQAPREQLLGYFENIYASGNRLMDLLTDLLDLSKLEAGRTNFDMGPQDVASVINTVASEVGPRLAERRMQLVIERPEVSPVAWCDERAVGQVLRNLITNAVHYSPESTPIAVSLRDRGAMLEVRVADRGIGVPEDERETIFGEFVQSSKTLSGVGGTGLGLAICRRIVRRHGGRIWVEPQPDGTGSIFAFTLPREAGDIVEENERGEDVSVAGRR